MAHLIKGKVAGANDRLLPIAVAPTSDGTAGMLLLSGAGPDNATQVPSPALEASLQVATGAGTLSSLLGVNTGPDQWIQIWDATGPTDGGAVLLLPFPVPGGKSFSLSTPLQYTRGCLVRNASAAVSANPNSNAGAADCWFLARHS